MNALVSDVEDDPPGFFRAGCVSVLHDAATATATRRVTHVGVKGWVHNWRLFTIHMKAASATAPFQCEYVEVYPPKMRCKIDGGCEAKGYNYSHCSGRMLMGRIGRMNTILKLRT
jgi:hypothetical protein